MPPRDTVPAGGRARRHGRRLVAAGVLALAGSVASAVVTVLALRGRAVALTIPSAPAAWTLLLAGLSWLRGGASALRQAWAARRIGRELAPLQARGWVVAHDLRVPGGHVDHVAVGPGGVFAIQARHGAAGPGAAWLASRLSTPVTAVVLVPGAARARTGDCGVV